MLERRRAFHVDDYYFVASGSELVQIEKVAVAAVAVGKFIEAVIESLVFELYLSGDGVGSVLFDAAFDASDVSGVGSG